MLSSGFDEAEKQRLIAAHEREQERRKVFWSAADGEPLRAQSTDAEGEPGDEARQYTEQRIDDVVTIVEQTHSPDSGGPVSPKVWPPTRLADDYAVIPTNGLIAMSNHGTKIVCFYIDRVSLGSPPIRSRMVFAYPVRAMASHDAMVAKLRALLCAEPAS